MSSYRRSRPAFLGPSCSCRWLLLLVAIVLQASLAVLASVPASDSVAGPLTCSDATPLSSGECVNTGITAAVGNESQCHDSHFGTEDELLASSDNNNTLEDECGDCQKELADAIAERDNLTQHSKSLEDKIERMKKDYGQVLNETWTDMEVLEDKVKRQTRTIKSNQERYQDTRKQMLKLDAELRRMHAAARSKYLNVTLIREDIFGGIGNAASKACRRMQKHWSKHHRRLQPRIHKAKMRYNRFRRETKPKVASLKRRMQGRWSRSKTIRPVVEVARATIARPVRAMYLRMEPTIEEVKIATWLSAMSFIKETSKLSLAYLEREDKLKQDAQERERKRRTDRMRRRHHKLDMHDDPPEKDYAPSPLNMRARTFFKYASANAERWCEKGLALMPLAVALSLTRSGTVGSLALLCGIPTLFIWIIVFIRVIVMTRAKRSKSLR